MRGVRCAIENYSKSSKSKGFLFVALYRGNALLASASVSERELGHAYVSCVKVAPHSRGRGLGSLLMRHVVATYPVLTLRCDPYDNSKLSLEETARFYEKFGFIRTTFPYMERRL